jgi:hypothetical protein
MTWSRFEEQRQALKRGDPSICSQLHGRALHIVRYKQTFSFGFSLRMSRLLFDRARMILSFFLGRSERRKLDAAPVPICWEKELQRRL